jgi:hypothetical protein
MTDTTAGEEFDLPEIGEVKIGAPIPTEPATLSETNGMPAAAPAEAPAERALPFDVEHLGVLRRAVLDHLVDTEGPQSVAQILAAMPAGTTRGSGESAIRREWEADRIERVGAGLYVLAKLKPPKQAKPAPQPSPTEESTWLARLDAWATDPSSWDVEAFGPLPNQPNNIPADIKARFNDRLRKRQERRREAEAAAAERTAADRELRSKLLAACNGNFQPGPGLDDLSPIKSVLEIVPLDRVLTTIRYKVDKRSYPANPTLVSWRDPVLLKEIAENYCRTLIVPRLIAAWAAAGSPAPTAQSSPPAGDMPDDIDELRGLHDSPSAPPGPHVMPRATLCRPGCAGERR